MATATSPITTNPYGICVDCGAPATGTAGMDGYCDTCGPKHNARTRQAIPVITTAAAPDVDLDEVDGILAILDTALEAYRKLAPLLAKVPGYTCGADRIVTFFAQEQRHAEYALTLWASGNQLAIRRHTSKYANGWQIRALEVLVGDDILVVLQWPSEMQPVETPEPEWRPADNDEQPVAEVTATAVREALRAPHWSDDATTSVDERAAEVVTSEVARG